MTIRFLIPFSAVVLFAFPALGFASRVSERVQAEDLIKQGNQYYQAKQYENAIGSYQKAIRMGFEGTSVYYNLGDAYYREGKIGYSILYYEKALRLSPNDQDIIHNLRIANSKTIDKIDALPKFFLFQWWESLLALFSTDGWARISYVFYLLLLASIGLYFYAKRPNWQRYSFFIGSISTIFLVITAALWIINLNRDLNMKEAIVVQPTAVVKLSPDSTSNDAFIIHEGLKVREMSYVGHWVEIKLQDGKEGWIEQSEIGTI
ncbi:MAG: tetratricopeptide repeat protein [Bacteroidetes bacterium]|nr:tetratricopeptide repeat protein [Bacteroidota bacterium]